MSKLKWAINALLAGSLLAAAIGLAPASQAASHREAPLISMDPTADITDFFMFRSYEAGHEDKVVFVMNVTSEEPSSGPNYFNFDPNVLYAISIDNDMDGYAYDLQFYFRFQSEYRGVPQALGLFQPYVGDIPAAGLGPITALDGAGSEGLGLRQSYSVTMVKGRNADVIADGLFAVPSNVGPKTMPDYDTLAAQGMYEIEDGIRVFAGQRDDPFYIDLGAVFDTVNLRSPGVDMLSGFNVHTIALEVPMSMLTSDGKGADSEHPVIGAYASTSRRATTVLRGRGQVITRGRFVQVQRLANPLINEVIIGTEDKDEWNGTYPHFESDFLDYYTNLRLVTALTLITGIPAVPIDGLGGILLTYGNPDDILSELLRLDLRVEPVALADQNPLTILAGDGAGWPNGRRPIDDVTDVALRVVGGTDYINAGVGDNVNVNDKPLPDTFPFIASPHDGRNRFHANP
ncbi:MAG: DUF4331 domain-containing protein [Anaerolineales bacterium]